MRSEYLHGAYAAERYRDFVREAEHDFLVQQVRAAQTPNRTSWWCRFIGSGRLASILQNVGAIDRVVLSK
jgi:hypothetical protein